MKIKGKICAGHGVASGKAGDLRYPQGTLKQQIPYFREKGVDLSPYFPGTINLDISPYSFRIGKPRNFLEEIDWSPHIPPENFYFFDLKLFKDRQVFEGLIYMPDPETKVEHEQRSTILELILPKIPGLQYGDTLTIEVPQEQLGIYNNLA